LGQRSVAHAAWRDAREYCRHGSWH
jgi:hypothetical protein